MRLNHAVLYVRDAVRSADFYIGVLGFRVVKQFPGGVFLQAPDSNNDHDLAVFSIGEGAAPSEAGRRTVGLYHLAWEVDTLDELERLSISLAAAGALIGASDHGTTKSLYGRDVDGIEFEVAWVVPADLLDDEARNAAPVRPLRLDEEQQKYGGSTPGGVGISVEAPARAEQAPGA